MHFPASRKSVVASTDLTSRLTMRFVVSTRCPVLDRTRSKSTSVMLDGTALKMSKIDPNCGKKGKGCRRKMVAHARGPK